MKHGLENEAANPQRKSAENSHKGAAQSEGGEHLPLHRVSRNKLFY